MSATDDVVVAPAASRAGVVGAVVSGVAGQAVVAADVVAFGERLPAASTASTAIVKELPHERFATVADVCPAEAISDPFR